MVTKFRVKIGEIGLLTLIRRIGIPKRMEYRNCGFKRFNGDNLAKSFKNLVNFGPVTPEFTRVVGIHPWSTSSLTTFAWRRHW